MSKLVGIKTYERFRSLWENDAIDEFSLNFIIDTGLLYTHGIFINGAVFGTAANGAVPLSIAGITNTLALSSHTHSNYLEKNADIDISSYKIKSGDKDLLFYSGGSLYLGNTTSPTYISGSNLYSVRGTNVYDILDTSNFSVSNTLPTGYTYNNTAYIKYGSNSHQIDYVKRINTSLSFDYLNTYTLAGTNLLNGVQYGYITLYTDNVYTNPSWAQLRINIPGKSIQYRTSADANTWINLDQPNIPLNALNVAGIVSAPSSTTTNKVWKTDGSGNPAWRDELSYTFSSLKFLLISGTDLMTYNTLAVRTILAGSNVSFSHNDGVLTINAQSPTYGVVSKTLAGLAPQLPNEDTVTKFLRQDGTWATPTYTSDTNTWRPIKINGTEKRGTAITSGDLNFINGSNTTVEWTSDNKLKINSTWTAWKGATESANGTVGYMPAPTSALRGQFLRGDGSWVSLNNYSLPTASNSTLGGVKTGAAITDTTGYTAVAIKDGVIYYKDTNTTYSFSNLLFLQTSGTNLMTYNSQAVRTVLAGSNVTFTHSNNVLTIAAKDTTYSTVSKTAAGLCPTLPNETTTTKYLRLDGSWVTPPDNNTWKAANASQEGYVPKSIANKILRANADGALYWGDDANTTYTFYNLQFQNSGGTTVDTYKPTTSPTKTLKAGSNVTISAASNVITIASTDTNTWRGILDNLTSSSNTTESLSAKQGYLLANGSARDNTKLPLAGGTMVGTVSASNDAYGGGGFNNGYANIILRGNTTTGTSGIVFSSSKGDTSINRPSDCAFIQFLPYGVAAATAVGTNPTINTSGEAGRFVIGIHNDSGDQLWLQTSAVNDLKHVVGASVYTIYDSGNLPAYPTKASWNYNDMYVASVSISGNNLRINKNGSNTDLTIPYATSAGSATYASSYLANRQSIGSSSQNHAQALQSYFNSYKSSIPRNCLTANYSSALSNGSLYFGYFLSGYDSAPYGGFYVCHYGTPYYVGISNGSYTQQQIITSSSIGSQSVNYATSAGSVAWSNVSSKPETATRWPSWSEVTSKPSTFAPALPARLTPHGLDTSSNRNANTTCLENGFYWVNAGTLPSNVGDANIITVNANTSYAHQLAFKFSGKGTTGTAYDGKDIYTRIYNNGSWLSWYTILTSGNSSVSKSGETLTVNIGGTSKSLTNTNTWRGIQNNLTSDSTTDSLSAALGKALNNKFGSYLPLAGGNMTTTAQILCYTKSKGSSDVYNGGILLREATGSTKSCTDNMYDAPGITFHWGGWWVHKLNMHTNALYWDNTKISLDGHTHNYAAASHTHPFSLITDGTCTSTTSGWSHVLSNTYGGSQKSIFYMCNGGGYGAHLRGYSTSASVYMLEIYNSSKQVFAVYGDGHSNFGGNVSTGSYSITTGGVSASGTSNRLIFRHLDGQNCNGDYNLYLQYHQSSAVTYFNGGTYYIKGGYYNGTAAAANSVTWANVSGKPTLLGAINYNNNSNSTYQVLWGSGNACYGTAGIYVNPYYNYVYATSFYTTSDRSKKQDISEFSEHIRKFQMKDTKTWHYGVIAQEVPEMFRDGEEGNMTVNYSSVLSYYVGCLENSVAGLEDAKRCLENKVKELEEKIKVLETKQNKLI